MGCVLRLLETLREYPRRVELVAVGGLLAAIVFVGLVGLFLNQRIEHVTDDVLRYDIELEARSNDLRAAVLDLGYSHRNLTTAGPSRGGIASLEQDYATLLQSIDSLEALGVRSDEAPQPEQLRALAEDYYSGFWPALDEPEPEFTQASDQGLVKLVELRRDAREVQNLSESRAQEGLEQAKATTGASQAVLIAVIGGLLAVGAILAYLAVRTVGDLRDLYSRQTEISGDLARSEERYRRTFENAAVGIAHLSLDGTFLRVNSRLCEMVGYTREELLETDWMSISHPGEIELNLRLRERHFRGETGSYSLQKRYIHKMGHEIWINLTASLLRDERGEPLYYIAFIEDISARKRAEEALRQSEERYALAVRGSNDGIWDWNPRTGEDYLSPRWKELLGFSEDELENREDTFFSRLHPDDERRAIEAIQQHLEEREPYSIDLRLRCKDGTYRWFHARGQAIWDESSQPLRMAGSITDITPRKQAEAALRESEERYRSIVQTANEGVWLIDDEANTLYINERMAAMLDRTPEQIMGREVSEFCFPEDVEEARQRITNNLRGAFEQFDFRFRREEDGELLVLACTSPVRDADASVVGALGMFTDVTDRKRAEDALRDSEERYRLLFEGNPHPMWVYDLQTLSFLAVNEAASHHYGYSREEFLAMTIEDIRPPEDIPALRQRVAIPLTVDEHAGMWRHRKKDGTVVDVEIVTHTLVFGGRHAKLVLAEDVTERHRAEEEIRQQAQLLDLSYEAIFAWELDGGIVYWNRGCEELYGFTKDEAIGSDSHQLLRTAHSMPLQSFKRTLERDGYWDGEVAHTTRTGRRITVESRHMLVQTPAGPLVLETNRDVTARKQAEEALAESLRSKTEFLADVSHELRTPLTSIRVNAEVGLQGRDRTAPLEEISRAAERMSRLVEDMLFLAHSDSGPPPLEPLAVSLAPFLFDLAGRAEALAGEYSASFDAHVSGEGEASLDAARVEQAVLILVSNAVKYGPPGGPVTFAATASDGGLCLIVEDRGPGISEEDLPYIFDRFYRGEARGSRGGSGLGLAIARTIAEAHGGWIKAENRPRGGARLSLYLPTGDDGQRCAAHPEESVRRSNETQSN